MKETVAYLNTILNSNDPVVIGLSGGSDSMCLLDILEHLKVRPKIICAHINHNIRKESKQELEEITKLCNKKNLIIETTTFAKKSKNQNYNELELREKRYQFFEEIIKKYNAKYLLTAHHGDDLIETILMRISRGSNLKGYSGFQIETQKEGYKILKPLIFTTKEEIEEYNKENNIKFFVDKTNEEDNYTRNRYRHNLLPFLKSENKNVHLKYLKFSKELIKYYDFVDDVVKDEITKRYNKKTLYLDGFKELNELVKTKIIEYILDDNYEKNLYLVSDKHTRIILDIIDNPKPNIEINLPDHLRITKSYDRLYVTRKENQKKDYYLLLEDETLLPNGRTIKIINEHEDTSNNVIRLNSKELSLPLYVRNRKKGDKMTIKNMKNAKKIKDIYIDLKLTTDQRDIQPIVVDSQGELIWIPGLKKSKFDKSKRENYDIILWYN